MDHLEAWLDHRNTERMAVEKKPRKCDHCGQVKDDVDLWAEDLETGEQIWACLECGQDDPYEVIDGEPTPFRVTYFSAWQAPQHLDNLTQRGKDQAVEDGRNQQFKVVVTLMTEPEPETWD